MRPESLAYWNELAHFVERHKAMVAAQEALSPELLDKLEEYWNGVTLCGEAFHPREAVARLLENVGRYESVGFRGGGRTGKAHQTS